MQLLAIKSGWSANRRFDIENGCVRILRDGQPQETILTVKDGRVTEAEDIEYPPGNPCDGIVPTRDWNEIERTKAGAIRTVSRYEAYWSLPVEGAFYEVQGLRIGRHKGTLRQLSRRSRFVREEFVYENKQKAYAWTPHRKKFRLHRPDGKLWLEVAAKVRRPWKRTGDLLEKIQATLGNIACDTYTWSDQPDYEIRLYDDRGRESGYGKLSDRQRVGVWRQGRTKHYFVMGVAVSKDIYDAGPDDLDPREVLKTENAQLRAALMKKIGPERLLRKLPFTVCDVNGGNRLLKADTRSIFGSDDESIERTRVRSRLDDRIAIAVLKCSSTGQLYYLRVPPRLNRVEHARQWLCGVDIESVEEEYIRDSWNRRMVAVDGKRLELSPSQQAMMQAEIARGKQRQELEFISEA